MKTIFYINQWKVIRNLIFDQKIALQAWEFAENVQHMAIPVTQGASANNMAATAQETKLFLFTSGHY
jgi:hypothetical protein